MENIITGYLDERKIDYRLLDHDKPAISCELASRYRNVPIREMIKCIFLVDKKKKHLLACLPGDKKLSLPKLRSLESTSRLSFASKADVTDFLGYQIGSIPPIHLKTNIHVIFDDSIKDNKVVNISTGDPCAGVELKLEDLLRLASPTFYDITE